MKYLCITKKQIMLFLSLVIAVTVVIVGSVGAYATANKLLPIYCVETDKKQIAISFDAAWGNTKKVQNITNPHNNWVCASSVFHKNPDFKVISQ